MCCSVTENFRETASPVAAGGGQLPGVFFFYDLSPIKVRFQEERMSFLAFLTSLCAIIGGTFTGGCPPAGMLLLPPAGAAGVGGATVCACVRGGPGRLRLQSDACARCLCAL